jgi:beta-N-acetylhexosaminidase
MSAVATRTAVARLMWIALDGTEVDSGADALLRAGVGGVVLFGRNIAGANELRELIEALRTRAASPLRVAIDHEGGHITRIGAPLTRFPSAMAIAATGSEELAAACATAAARELAWLGVDVNLAPVVDVVHEPRNPSIGVRSFGASIDDVARFAGATIRGLRAGGVQATAKHFPGHGRTVVDSHHALPLVDGGLDALRRLDLPPFRAAIDAGIGLVMASHLAVDGLTDGLPASLSRAALVDLLRTELGFEGLVLTDALDMGAVADGFPVPEAAARAVAAGADAVMPIADQPDALNALERDVRDGRIGPRRLAEALSRAEGLDASLRATADPAAIGDLPVAEHEALAAEVARRSLTRHRAGRTLPLRAGTSVAVIDFPTRRPSPVEEPGAAAGGASLAEALARHGLRVSESRLTGEPERENEERRTAHDAAAGAEAIVLATRDAFLWPADVDLVGELAAAGPPVVLVALRNPYDLAALPATDEAVAAYADVPASIAALADALTGRADWPGRLPARIGSTP